MQEILTISTNDFILAFVQNNFILIGLVLALFKVIAEETPWAIDNKFHQVFTKFIGRND